MPYIHTCNRCKRKATSQDGSRPTCKQKACRNSRKGGMMSRGMFVPPCASCGGELVETPSGLLTCFSCSGNGMMTLDVAKKKYHEKMRPQYEADARRHEQKMAERTALIAKLPFALPVEGIALVQRAAREDYEFKTDTDRGSVATNCVRPSWA